jgi:cytochrome c-type biogenesis protein CcmH
VIRAVRALLLTLAAVATMAAASDPSERLADPREEARARQLFQEVRCLVCQNESIDDSEAPLAADLRRIIRDQIRAGRTDAQILAFLRARYGDFVLLQPPFDAANLVLWGAPFLVVAAGAGLFLWRRRSAAEAAPLSRDEEAELAQIVADEVE